ncbi:ABC transporter ATP-binding protein [Arenibacterium sp. LLYu02]|uniref:ABC transporter ATP-binding protein n=1 Tax=Arenibacterium sp. LLYu02 TaxID=3404132 RepID=UPI003B21F7B0
MSEIELKSVGKSYGAVSVLDKVSLVMGAGEFVVLVGPSGCGKSTLLRMIAGLEDISSGEITIGGKVVNNMPAKERDLAMVFQNYALYPHMKVAENMSFALKLAGVAKDEIARRVAVAAEILGLEQLLDRLPRALSGGQRQRVAMGRAIVRDPRAFLFDEPLSNLDAKLRHKMRGEIRRLHQRLGRTMIYVTHDQTEAMTMADRIVVMNAGRIEQAGTPRALFDDPDTLFVAGFIGTPEINCLNGVIAGAEVVLDCGLRFAHELRDRPAEGTPIICGFRPHTLTLTSEVGQGLEAELLLIEPTGVGQELLLRLAGQELTVVSEDQRPLQVGQRLTLAFDTQKALIFDRASTERLR